MAKRSNPKLIGGFVLGAIALVVIGAFAFGGGNFLKPKAKAVLFFVNSSLSGLTVGSPVTFRGITVGAVTDLKIKYDWREQSYGFLSTLRPTGRNFRFSTGSVMRTTS